MYGQQDPALIPARATPGLYWERHRPTSGAPNLYRSNSLRMEDLMNRLIIAAFAAAAIGCQADDTPAADSQAPATAQSAAVQRTAEEDLSDVTNYKLSMEKIDKYFAAQRNIATRVRAMSPAERAAMNSDNNSANASLDDMARNMDRHPALKSAIEDADLSTREYATLTMAMVQAGMAASVLQMRPNDNQDSLAREMKASMANIRFMREHEAEITQRQKAMEAEFQRMDTPQN